MGNLQSAKTSQPEKYIMYQTFFLVFFRMLYIPFILYLVASRNEISGDILFFGTCVIDMFVTHFIIQASYLSANKKHVESLFNSCGCRKNKISDNYTSTMESTIVAATN
ncbi:hypothetical protein GCK72_019884 [Caenorhabditis remanei]|uniref:Uncharacterized protein n=1 Tax=Caenorhabditis remanei TaxID=31234 RepID=A0A6A5GDW8_CAERE|nr:hypothetical protein GCK72_019884 [Caenorhabditis remanei]KAF1753328.1 hypothetical protein GCK72_019884 [Caenorhabditis remanei]